MKFRIALVLTAAAVAFWITEDSRSFLYVFLCTFFACVLAVGLGLAIHGLWGPPTPTRTYAERDLREIEWQEFLRGHPMTTIRTTKYSPSQGRVVRGVSPESEGSADE